MSNAKLFSLTVFLAAISGVVTLVVRSGGIGSTLNMMQAQSTMLETTSPPSNAVVDSQNTMMKIRGGVPYPGGGGFAPDVVERSYQQYASFGLVVKDVNAYVAGLKSFITSQGGIVTNQSLNRSSKYVSAYLTARVPVGQLDAVSNKALEGVKEIANQNISNSDMTSYRQDLQNTIATIKKQISQQELLRTQAKTDYEKKKIDLEIADLQTQLDNYEKQVANNKDQVAYATLDVTAADSMKYFDGQPVGVWDEVTTSFSSLESILRGAVKLAVWVGVYSLVWLPVLLVARWVLGRK